MSERLSLSDAGSIPAISTKNKRGFFVRRTSFSIFPIDYLELGNSECPQKWAFLSLGFKANEQKSRQRRLCYNLTIMTEPQPAKRETIPLEPPELEDDSRANGSTGKQIGFILLGILLLGLVIAGLVLLLQPGTNTARVRDIFIIFMALEFLLIGVVMIILIIQIARLTLLLQNEIKPIIESTSETANTLRGTTIFLSEHLVEPVMKLNQYLAGMNRIIGFFRTNKE